MSRARAPERSVKLLLAAAPLALWLCFFLVIPVALVFWYSLLRRGPYGEVLTEISIANYLRVFDPLYAGVFLRSAMLAALTTMVCMVLGFFVALAMTLARPGLRGWLFIGLMIPFLTNFIVRVYAVRILLSVEGPLNALLLTVGLVPTPLLLNDSILSVGIGMVINYLPFMVLPVFVVLDKIDFQLLEAAADLGASWWVTIRRVLLPAAWPGLVSGAALVMVPVLGEFMIPDLLGGAKNMLIGNLITEQFLKVRDWPFGAALASVLIAGMIVMAALHSRMGVGAGQQGRGNV
jgi:spermidine/putrescine transport system permease protein